MRDNLRRDTKSYDGEKAWSSMNHLTLSSGALFGELKHFWRCRTFSATLTSLQTWVVRIAVFWLTIVQKEKNYVSSRHIRFLLVCIFLILCFLHILLFGGGYTEIFSVKPSPTSWCIHDYSTADCAGRRCRKLNIFWEAHTSFDVVSTPPPPLQLAVAGSVYIKTVQCCGFGMYIPDPDFFRSRIQQRKRNQKNKLKISFRWTS